MYLGVPTFSLPSYGLPVFGIPGSSSQSSGVANVFVLDFEFTILGDESAITPDLYKYISDRYSLVYKTIQDTYITFNDIVTYVAQLDNVEAKLDLLRPLRQSSREFRQHRYISQLYAAVIQINRHVFFFTLQDINQWLAENDTKVTIEWATLCADTGTIIDDSNIGEIIYGVDYGRDNPENPDGGNPDTDYGNIIDGGFSNSSFINTIDGGSSSSAFIDIINGGDASG